MSRLKYGSGQISIIPKPELRGFWGSSLIKPPFRVTSADVVIICPDGFILSLLSWLLLGVGSPVHHFTYMIWVGSPQKIPVDPRTCVEKTPVFGTAKLVKQCHGTHEGQAKQNIGLIG